MFACLLVAVMVQEPAVLDMSLCLHVADEAALLRRSPHPLPIAAVLGWLPVLLIRECHSAPRDEL